MQLHHGCLIITFRDKRPDLQAAVDRLVYQRSFLLARRLQYIIYYGIFIAGMTDADAQAPEIFGGRCAAMSFKPLCPPSPPSSFSREVPGGKSSSS